MRRKTVQLIKATGEVVLTLPERVLGAIYEERFRKTSLRKPVIIFGPDRSGTSLVYSLLANHPDVFSPTAAASLFPGHPVTASLIRRFLSLWSDARHRSLPGTNAKISGGLTAPREAVHYWFHHLGSRGGGWKNADHDFMTEEDLDEATRQILPLDLRKRMTILKRRRLVVKQPGFSLKLRYLNALFPDAIFVHCLRHPVDNFHSLMVQKRRYDNPNWGIHIPGWRQYKHLSTEAQTAQQLAGTHELIQQSLRHLQLPPDRYIPVRYESLTAHFIPELQRLFQGCDLEVPADMLQHPENYVRPGGIRQRLEMPDDPEARKILAQLAADMGYTSFPAAPAARQRI